MTVDNENKKAIAELVFPIGLLFWAILIIGCFIALIGGLPIENVPSGIFLMAFALVTWIPAYAYIFFYPNTIISNSLMNVLQRQSDAYIKNSVDWFDMYRDHFGATLLIAALSVFVAHYIKMVLAMDLPLLVDAMLLCVLFVIFLAGIIVYIVPIIRVIGMFIEYQHLNPSIRLIAVLIIGLLDYGIFNFSVQISSNLPN